MAESVRQPIVTVLGHVDHGKTSLLDAIRKTNVASKEAGGITQGIGASEVQVDNTKKITFIDTPGHAAFSQMRSRGASVCDLAILVVAADDGVKPQTKEALEHIKLAKIPFIVALTKIDLPTADSEMVLGQLEKEGVFFEGRGGDVVKVEVSAKTGKGIKELLEMILLIAEVNELKVDTKAQFEAVVIETTKDKRGPLVSVVVRNGLVNVGDLITAEGIGCKVRALFDARLKSIKEVGPGEPCQILGFSELPAVGTRVVKGEGLGLSQAKAGQEPKDEKGGTPVFIKTTTAGSLEALLSSLPEGVSVIGSGVGDVYESDVLLAKTNGATIVCFESKASQQVTKLAESEGVRIETFRIIYELIDRLAEMVKGDRIDILGKAQILALFPFNNKKVCGLKVTEGTISKGGKIQLIKEGLKPVVLKILSMKKGKLDIGEAKQGEELGVIFDPQLDFKVGDVIVSVSK